MMESFIRGLLWTILIAMIIYAVFQGYYVLCVVLVVITALLNFDGDGYVDP